MKLGVDIGGVLIDRINDNTDTSFFGANYLRTTAVPHAFEALRQLRQAGFTIHLVSKCGDNVQQKSRQWLAHHRFFEFTGIPAENLHFCRTRPEKAPISTRLGLQGFVDDRLDVLDYLTDVPHLFLFQPNERDAARHRFEGGRAVHVQSWREVLEKLAVPV